MVILSCGKDDYLLLLLDNGEAILRRDGDGATVKNLVKTQGDTAHIYAVWQ